MSLNGRRFYEFGPYRLDPVERSLFRRDQPVALTPKNFETLLTLLENAGHAVEKEALLRRVWPDSFVEEGSLTQNISVLRKILGGEDGQYIETVPKRGYRFVAPVGQSPAAEEEVVVDEHTVAEVTIEKTETTSRQPSLWIMVSLMAALLLAAAGGYLVTRRGSPPVKSLAVLPLKSLDPAAEQRHLELGIADSIIGKLSEIPGLTVRPTGAVRKYLNADPLQAAQELKVDAVMDGTLQVAGNRIRVNLNLLRTSGGASIWRHVFDVAAADILQVEDEIALQVTRHLRLDPDNAGRSRIARRSTSNPEAYQHYLKALYSNEAPRTSSRAAIETAIARFRKTTELDPSFAKAWAQLAICYGELVNFYEPDRDLSEAARDAASRAYALDPELPELLLLRAQTFWSWRGRYQIEEAMRELRRGAGHNDAAVHSLLGVLYSHAGLEREAVAELHRAIEIDPANSLHLDRLAQACLWVGNYQEARAAYDRALAMESEEKGDLSNSGITFLYLRDFQQARRRLEKAQARNPRDVKTLANLALLAALDGRIQEARAAIPADTHEGEKFRDGHHAFVAYAQIRALEGNNSEAVRWLRAAADTGMPNYPMFARDPYLAGIRGSAEFRQFMAGLKPRWDALRSEIH